MGLIPFIPKLRPIITRTQISFAVGSLLLCCHGVQAQETVEVSGAELELVKCPLQATVFLNNQCVTCLQPMESGTEPINQALSLEALHNSNDFVLCRQIDSTFGRELVKQGALDLNGRTLDVVTIQRSPFSEVIQDQDGVVTYRGIIFEFLHAIDVKYNFSMRISTPPDGYWGAKNPDGSWNGMVGMVLRNEAELGAASFSVTLDRARVIRFTKALHQEPTAILIPPPIEEEKLTVLIKPLSPKVWLGLALSLLLIVPTFFAFQFTIPTKNGRKNSGFVGKLSKIGLYITGSLVQQGVDPPACKTTRVLIGIWWMVTLVLANAYIAFLVSDLSVPQLHNPVNTLDELTHQSRIRWTFRQGTAHYALFKSATSSGVFRTIGEGVKDEDLVNTDIDGVEKVLNGKWAFIKEKSFLDVALDHDFHSQKKCRLTLAKEEFFIVGVGLIVQMKCPYLRLLDYEISQAISTGVLTKWKNIHWPKELYCANAEKYILSMQPSTRKLGLPDVQGAYFLLGCGLSLAILALLLEIFHSWTARAIKNSIHKLLVIRNKTPWVYLR